MLEQKLSRHNPVPHIREVEGKLLLAIPKEHPQVHVDILVDEWNGSSLPPPVVAMLCDTGAQVDCVSVATMKKLGLTEDLLLRPRVSQGCANDTGADVMGVFFGLVMAKHRGKQVKSKVMFYVLTCYGWASVC